ncbi:phospholipase D family protein [soil metagenome]
MNLADALAPRLAAHPGLSGIHSLLDPHEAFAARMRFARIAERTLDVQYYIWRADMTGVLLFRELHQAAERGVRVRLLLDDNNTVGLDAMLTALDLHPNIEVRLFNPSRFRRFRLLNIVTNFSRANRRMHNKSMTVDNAATLIGGRNVGDEYFGAGHGPLFTDLDVAAIGPAVQAVSDDFERYWSCECAVRLAEVVAPGDSEQLERLLERAQTTEQRAEARQYVEAVHQTAFMTDLIEDTLVLDWAPTQLVSDDPRKGIGKAAARDLVLVRLGDLLGEPKRVIDLVSAYFVPAKDGTARLVALAQAGVQIRILTNSLDATDVAAVHAGYAKRRRALLKAGVRLFELRRVAPRRRGRKNKLKSGPLGSSSSSLHAKTFAVDEDFMFVGSFNFDPRSARLNTELGFLIDSRKMAGDIDRLFDDRVPELAYEVVLGRHGRMNWIEQVDGRTVRHPYEPDAAWFRRASVVVLSFLPIEWLL